MDYGCQLYNSDSPGRLKVDKMHRKCIRIYTGAFKTLPVKALYVEANDLLLELRSILNVTLFLLFENEMLKVN